MRAKGASYRTKLGRIGVYQNIRGPIAISAKPKNRKMKRQTIQISRPAAVKLYYLLRHVLMDDDINIRGTDFD